MGYTGDIGFDLRTVDSHIKLARSASVRYSWQTVRSMLVKLDAENRLMERLINDDNDKSPQSKQDGDDAIDLVRLWVIDHGYDGLFCESANCACDLNSLASCGGVRKGCRPGYFSREGPKGETDFNWYILPKKPIKMEYENNETLI